MSRHPTVIHRIIELFLGRIMEPVTNYNGLGSPPLINSLCGLFILCVVFVAPGGPCFATRGLLRNVEMRGPLAEES